MTNNIPQLLNPTELLDIYGIPILNDNERQKHFTLNAKETSALKSFTDSKDAIYFVICLVFFKIKQTFIDFTYQEITAERNHVVERYFSHKPSPKSLPTDYSKSRIKNKVLILCGYQRLTKQLQAQIKQELHESASHYPRQRQLCKDLLNHCVKFRVAIPGYSTLQHIVSKVWNNENKRVIQSYLRCTTKNQRTIVLSLLHKTDEFHQIISIKKDMKGFNAHELWREIDKHNHLKPIFDIACLVLPQLKLPEATITYYADLIYYYSGPGLKQINPNTIGLYLLCYTYTRYQALNDNLLDAFKKCTLDYKKKAKDYADAQALKHLDVIRDLRERVSDVLISIKNYPSSTHVPKEEIYAYIPENQLLIVAQLLVDDSLNKDLLFWKYIDEAEDSIKITLRKLFLVIDFIVTNNDDLKAVISYVKDHLTKNSFTKNTPLSSFQSWIGRNYRDYVIDNNTIIHNRFEFLLYLQMVHHLSTNNLTLKYSIKHKKVEDEILDKKRWDKEKKAILKKLNCPKLDTPLQKTLDLKRTSLTALYKTVNNAIEKGENTFIKTKLNKRGERIWRLSPLQAGPDPNESLFGVLPQRSIVDVIKFVNHQTKFDQTFDPILPKSKKGPQNIELIIAVILANAIRIGARKMSDISDLNESSLISAEASYVRIETLLPAIDKINNAIAKFPIYKKWYINSVLHGSLDGLKLQTSLKNSKARHSRKYFNDGIGVSGYNEIVNSLSIAGRLIGSHEYEGHFIYEMVLHLNTSDIKPTHLSTDKHGMNALNFALFDFMEMVFAPRIPKIHRETLWGFGSPKDYEGFLVKPTKFVDENFMNEEWDNIQRLMASLLTGESNPTTIIRKLSSKDYVSNTKKALVQYNNIVKSEFILRCLHDPELRRAMMYALNRGEAYNNLVSSNWNEVTLRK